MFIYLAVLWQNAVSGSAIIGEINEGKEVAAGIQDSLSLGQYNSSEPLAQGFCARTENPAVSNLYESKRYSCGYGCTSCTDKGCTSCQYGYYLSGSSCWMCNSCCSSCYGSSASSCYICAGHCHENSNGACVDCHPSCLTCNGRGESDCIICESGYAKMADKCLKNCPRGYVAKNRVCLPDFELSFVLDSLNKTVYSPDGKWRAKVGDDDAAPLPIKARGYYFTGSQYLTTTEPVSLSPSLTFGHWVRPKGYGVRTIVAKQGVSAEVFSMKVSDSNAVLVNIGGQFSASSQLTLKNDVWSYVVCTLAYSNMRNSTDVVFYIDGRTDVTRTLRTAITDDDLSPSGILWIGAASAGVDEFSGYIWRVEYDSFVRTLFLVQNAIVKSGCPLGFDCLSSADFKQTEDGDDCLPECRKGCVRTSDCSLCDDDHCNNCFSFGEYDCLSCFGEGYELKGGYCHGPITIWDVLLVILLIGILAGIGFGIFYGYKRYQKNREDNEWGRTGASEPFIYK